MNASQDKITMTGSRRVDVVQGWEVRSVSYSDGTRGYAVQRFNLKTWRKRHGTIDVQNGTAFARPKQWENKALIDGELTTEEIKDDIAELEEIANDINSLIKDRESFLVEGKFIEVTLSVEEVAAYVGVGEETVRRWCRSGKLGHYKIGNLIRIKSSDIQKYLADSYHEVR